jgi:hypothetical protein
MHGISRNRRPRGQLVHGVAVLEDVLASMNEEMWISCFAGCPISP